MPMRNYFTYTVEHFTFKEPHAVFPQTFILFCLLLWLICADAGQL